MNKIVAVSAATAVPLKIISPSIASEVVDPIFAAIEAHRAACIINERCVDVEFALLDGDPAKPAAEAATRAAIDEMFDLAYQLLKIVPTSSAGAAALLSYVGDHVRLNSEFPEYSVYVEEDADLDGAEEFPLAIMKHVADALGSIRDGISDPAISRGQAPSDPIFARIGAHRQAYDAIAGSTDDEELSAVSDGEMAAADELAKTVPTTLEGLFAILSYLRIAIEQQSSQDDFCDGFELLFGDQYTIFVTLAKAAERLRQRAMA